MATSTSGGQQPQQSKEVVFDLDAAAFSGDEFRMYQFKVKRCPRARPHDWTQCPFAHPGEKAKRRDPRRYRYSGTACPEFRRNGCCRRGDACPFAHGVFECWLHPSRYRTQMCTDGSSCKRRVCFFAHTDSELRKPEEDPVWLQQQLQAELAAEQQVHQQIQALKVFTNMLSSQGPQTEALKGLPATQLSSLFPGIPGGQTVGSPPSLASASVSAPAGSLEEKVKAMGGEAVVMQLLELLDKGATAPQPQPLPSMGSAPQNLSSLLSSLAGGSAAQDASLEAQAQKALEAIQAASKAPEQKSQQQQLMEALAAMMSPTQEPQSMPTAQAGLQSFLRSLGVDMPADPSPPTPPAPTLTPVHSVQAGNAANASDFAALLSAALGGGAGGAAAKAAPPTLQPTASAPHPTTSAPMPAASAPLPSSDSLPTPFGILTNNAAAGDAPAPAPAAAGAPAGGVDVATVMAVLQQTGLLNLLPERAAAAAAPAAAAAAAPAPAAAATAAAAPAPTAAPAAASAAASTPAQLLESTKSVNALHATLASLGLSTPAAAVTVPPADLPGATPEQQSGSSPAPEPSGNSTSSAGSTAQCSADGSASPASMSPSKSSSAGSATATAAVPSNATSPAASTAPASAAADAKAAAAEPVQAEALTTDALEPAKDVSEPAGAAAGMSFLPPELQSLLESLTAKPEMLAHAQKMIDDLKKGAVKQQAAPVPAAAATSAAVEPAAAAASTAPGQA